MEIATIFSEFDKKLTVSVITRCLISSRCDSIAKRLNKDFRGIESSSYTMYVGSFGRNTANERVSDIDMIFILPWSVYEKYNKYIFNGQSALLQAIKHSLCKTYPNTELKGDGQIVHVGFSDGMTFELLPCFENIDHTFTFADSNNGGSWRVTNPRAEIKAFKDKDDECNKNLYSLCRMARAWKYNHAVNLKSCIMDILAYRFLGDYIYKDKSYLYYDYMLRDFFRYLSSVDTSKSSWRMPGSNQCYSNYLNFQYKAKQAYNACVEAIDADSQKHDWTASQKWRSIFGYDFPIL